MPGKRSAESGTVDFNLIFKNPVKFHGFELMTKINTNCAISYLYNEN